MRDAGEGDVHGQERLRRKPEPGRHQDQDPARREIPEHRLDRRGRTGSERPDPAQAPDGTLRTTAPYDIYPAFSALTRTVDKINTADLAKAFRTLASDFSGTPQSVRPLVTGLSRLSTTIASRDAQLHILLSRANQVTGMLADRSGDLQELLHDGNLLLQELNARRARSTRC